MNSNVDGIISTNIKVPKHESSTNQVVHATTITGTQLSSITEDVYIVGINKSNYRLYYHSYDAVRSWAINSIDLVKTQLLSLCFPLFIHW